MVDLKKNYCCDEISKRVLKAMHELAAALDGLSIKNGATSLSVDYISGTLTYENILSRRIVKANINGDSERGAIIDFARRILLHE